MEFCRVSGGDPFSALPFAAAIEMIHTYSLIHDDLPCMDDDDFRRGKPTSHKMFGEAVAVLAGDALLTRAFELISNTDRISHIPAARSLKAIYILSRRAGIMGMIGGQMLDMAGECEKPDLAGLVRLQQLKTGALIEAAALIGCVLGGASEEQIASAAQYAADIGLAFQIRDDMLDVEGDPTLLGKAVGMDASRGKATFPGLVGMDGCQKRIDTLTDSALSALSSFENNEFLKHLTLELARRNT
jgi:geranylgeranyl diphosphate synthase type II